MLLPPHSRSHWCTGTSCNITHTTIKCRQVIDALNTDVCRIRSPLQLGEVHHVADRARLTHAVDSPQPCVGVAGVKGLEAVAQVPLARHLGQSTGQILRESNELIRVDTTTLTHLLLNPKQHGRNTDHTATERSVPVPDKRVGHHERDRVRMRPTYCLHGNRYVSKWHLIIADSNLLKKKNSVRNISCTVQNVNFLSCQLI